MSYRDLRNFSESMRALGFPTPVSVESFRQPNWPLLGACTRWLAARLEPDVQLPATLDTVEQRVQLVVQATQLFHSRANLKLSGVRLYGADGWALRELLKVTALLRAANDPTAHSHLTGTQLSYDVTNKVGEIKQARSLATDITAQGALLYDLLANEPHNKEKREAAVSRPLELSQMETSARRALAALATRANDARDKRDAAAAATAAVDDKIQRRKGELQRARARLSTVQNIRPAYAGELSALETELSSLWEQWVLRYRTVEALKHQLSVVHTRHHQAAEEQQAAILQLIHKYEGEDVLHKLTDTDDNSSSEDAAPAGTQPPPRTTTRLRVQTAAAGVAAGGGRAAYGNMSSEARDSLDDIRADDDDSNTDTDLDVSVEQYGTGAWPRPRPRPATRTLAPAAGDNHYPPPGTEDVAGDGGDSLGSSSDSELQLHSGAGNGRHHELQLHSGAGNGRHHAPARDISDDEF